MNNIKIERLKTGNKILLETESSIFEITIVDPNSGEVTIYGGKRFLKETNAKLVGVYGRLQPDDEDKLIFLNEISKNLGLEIRYQDKDNIFCDFVTSPVVSAKIYGDNWEFEMWEDENIKRLLGSSLEEARSRLRIKNGENNEGSVS